MKKVLFATTALVATAGMAAADVNLSGYGGFGILYQEGAMVGAVAATAGPDGLDGTADDTAAVAGYLNETRIESRFRLNIDASAEADNGLTFGARVRMQSDDNAAGGVNATYLNNPRFTVSSGGLTVGVGNTLGAIDSMPGLYAGSIGLSGLGWANVVTNFGSDTYHSSTPGRNGVEVIYSGGNFGAHMSYSDLGGIQRTALALSYTMNNYTVALGYQDSNVLADAEWVLTLGGKLGMVDLGLAVAQNYAGNTSATLSGAFKVGSATTLTAYVAMDENQVTQEAYGLGVVHSLGGGASIRGGVADTHGTTRADLGLQFNF